MEGRSRDVAGAGRTTSRPRPGWATCRVPRGPLHAQIGEVIEHAIGSGDLQPGDRLPPERELAAWFGVNRLTLRQALSDLERRRPDPPCRSGARAARSWPSRPCERDLSPASPGSPTRLRRLGLTASARAAARRGDAGRPTRSPAASSSTPGHRSSRSPACAWPTAGPSCSRSRASRRSASPACSDSPSTARSTSCWPVAYDARPCRAVESLEPVQADGHAAQLLERRPRRTVCCWSSGSPSTPTAAPVEFARDLFRGDRTHMVVWSFDVARPLKPVPSADAAAQTRPRRTTPRAAVTRAGSRTGRTRPAHARGSGLRISNST